MLPDRPPPAPSDWPGRQCPSLHAPLAGERDTRILKLWPAKMKTFRVDYNPMGALHMESRAKTSPRQKQNNSEQKAEQHRKTKKTYGSGRPLQAMCRWAPSVTDRPLHHAGDPVRSFLLGDLPVLPSGWVQAIPVLEVGVHPILNRLHQPLTDGLGHHDACQSLGRRSR